MTSLTQKDSVIRSGVVEPAGRASHPQVPRPVITQPKWQPFRPHRAGANGAGECTSSWLSWLPLQRQRTQEGLIGCVHLTWMWKDHWTVWVEEVSVSPPLEASSSHSTQNHTQGQMSSSQLPSVTFWGREGLLLQEGSKGQTRGGTSLSTTPAILPHGGHLTRASGASGLTQGAR